MSPCKWLTMFLKGCWGKIANMNHLDSCFPLRYIIGRKKASKLLCTMDSGLKSDSHEVERSNFQLNKPEKSLKRYALLSFYVRAILMIFKVSDIEVGNYFISNSGLVENYTL